MAKLNIVLLEPEIPANTGNIGRTCVATGTKLHDRLEKDVAMMKKAGINTIRIAESTWSTCEPQEGVFDFSHVTRVMDAMEEAGIFL